MDWQEVAALGVVVLTFALMVRSGYRSIRLDRGRSCPGCSGCAADLSADSLKVPENWRTLRHE